MLELINQLDGFDPRGNIKVLMATNRPDTLDPALVRPGRLDRKVEFGLPDLEVSVYIYRWYTRLITGYCWFNELVHAVGSSVLSQTSSSWIGYKCVVCIASFALISLSILGKEAYIYYSCSVDECREGHPL